jgi:hypothetical protein
MRRGACLSSLSYGWAALENEDKAQSGHAHHEKQQRHAEVLHLLVVQLGPFQGFPSHQHEPQNCSPVQFPSSAALQCEAPKMVPTVTFEIHSTSRCPLP